MNLDDIIDSVAMNIINGNREDALNQLRDLNSFHSAYVSVMIIEYESLSDESKRWFINALYKG